MAKRMLPLLYLNLGGEMIYIIDQRLIAQRVPQDRAAKGIFFCRVLPAAFRNGRIFEAENIFIIFKLFGNSKLLIGL